MKLHRDRPGDFEILKENVASIDQHVIALFDIALIECSGCEAESRAAPRRYRIVGISQPKRLVSRSVDFSCCVILNRKRVSQSRRFCEFAQSSQALVWHRL